MLSKLRSLVSSLWLLISTAPVWAPAVAAVGALHVAGLASVSYIRRRSSGDDAFSRSGVSWSLSLPLERIPFVTYSLAFTAGFLWDPRYWSFEARDVFNSGASSSVALGPLDFSFYLSPTPVYEINA